MGGLTPSVNVLFLSAVSAAGAGAICGLLTGMGSDGASGLLETSRGGGWIFTQSEESCVVYGMPHAAVEKGATNTILPLDVISSHLRALVGEAGIS